MSRFEILNRIVKGLVDSIPECPCHAGEMLFFIDHTAPEFVPEGQEPERWIRNMPIHGFKDGQIYVGWGIPIPLFYVEEYGLTCTTDRVALERKLNK